MLGQLFFSFCFSFNAPNLVEQCDNYGKYRRDDYHLPLSYISIVFFYLFIFNIFRFFINGWHVNITQGLDL